MKQLKKLKLHDVTVMNEMEMKNIRGGEYEMGGTICDRPSCKKNSDCKSSQACTSVKCGDFSEYHCF